MLTTNVDETLLAAERAQYRTPSAEISVLLGLSRTPAELPAVAAFLKPQHFWDEKYSQIYQAMLRAGAAAANARQTVVLDLVTLTAVAESLGITIDRQSLGELRELSAHHEVKSTVMMAHIVRDDAARRHLHAICRNCQVGMDGKPMGEVLAAFGMYINTLAAKLINTQSDDLYDALVQVLDDPHGRHRWHNVRFPAFFAALGGLRRGSLTVLSGRSKAGKSLVVANCILGFAEAGVPVLWLDTEMTAAEQAERLACIISGLGSAELHQSHNAVRVAEARRQVGRVSPLIRFVNVTDFGCAIATIRQFAQDTYSAGVVVYDWFRAMGGDGRKPEYLVLGEMASALKNVAVEAGLPIFATNQESRAAIGATYQDRVQGGEKFQSGSDKITQVCSASCSIVPLTQEMFSRMQDAFPCEHGPMATHALIINVQRHGTGQIVIPVHMCGMAMTEVNNRDLAKWLSSSERTKRRAPQAAKLPPVLCVSI